MTDSVTHTPRPGTLRSFIGGVFSLLLTRAELLSLEAEEQKDRLLATLLLGGLALVCLLLGLMAMLLVIVLVTAYQLTASGTWADGYRLIGQRGLSFAVVALAVATTSLAFCLHLIRGAQGLGCAEWTALNHDTT
ncbi:hypothetical protein [Paludibacterium denitrificans]|uniref:hypothetical protein n=1 Tax=Paludibacterium denitrificans TaxID=2675226 RepID=UPI001E5BE6B3|nr:hypothetical protein [Paludibacterium denitrificans]